MDNPINAIEAKQSQKDLAVLLHDYRQSLIESGFSRREAWTIMLDYQRSLINQAKNSD